MHLEVVLKLPCSDENRIEELLYLRVAQLGLAEYFTDEVDGSLYLVHVTWLILFDNQGHTDHVGSRRDLEEQSLSVFWRCEDGWSCEELFELLEGHNSFLVPLELVGLPEKFEEG